jgi:hypothetical protein
MQVLGELPSHCHFVRHKSIMTAVELNPGLGGKTTAVSRKYS